MADDIPGHAGCTMAQVYAGVNTQYLEGYPMKTKADMPGTLYDVITNSGAPQTLLRDNAKKKVAS